MEKTILAIDAALGPCSVAVLRGAEVLAYSREERPQMQARRLISMVEDALKEAGTTYAGVESIVCTTGPGMFTGLRIGLAAAHGIGFALKKPVVGITTLATVALAAHQKHPGKTILAALNAGKGETYFQLFSTALVPMTEAMLGAPELLFCHPALVAGSGQEERSAPVIRRGDNNIIIAGNIPPEWAAGKAFLPLMPDATAAGMAAGEAPALLTSPEPFYIRPPDAKLPAQ